MTDLDRLCRNVMSNQEAADAANELSILRRLRAYVEARCKCPYCHAVRECLCGCTYRRFNADGWNRMQAARKAMWGDA